MFGIGSFLDDAHSMVVEQIWAELAATLDLRGVYLTPFPHFSYQIAPNYDPALLEPRLADLARASRPFTVTVAGLGVFSGPSPVVYLAIVRTAALSAFHALVWEAGLPAAREPVPYYHPESWMPHITIAFSDVDLDKLAGLMRRLGARVFDWQITVDHVVYITAADGRQSVARRLPFGQ